MSGDCFDPTRPSGFWGPMQVGSNITHLEVLEEVIELLASRINLGFIPDLGSGVVYHL